MLPSDPLFHKPKDIIAAKNILYATIFLGFINWGVVKMTNDPSSHSIFSGFITPFLTLLVIFILTKQIGFGRKWARTVFLVLFILGIIAYSFAIIPLFKSNLLLGVLYVFQTLLEMLALKFLFSQKSTHWFNGVWSADR